MRVVKPGILCLSLFLISCIGLSQTIRFKRYTTSHGLLSEEVYNMLQDKKGYLWLLTNYGAMKYNGKTFKPVLQNLPFSESFMYAICENGEGRKWAASSNSRIYEIINDSAFVVKGTEAVSDLLRQQVTEILQLHVDDSLNIYAITKHDSYKFLKTKGAYIPHKLSIGTQDSITYRIYEKNNRMFRVLNYTNNDTIFCGGREHLKMLFYLRDDTSYIKLDCEHTDPRIFKRFGRDIYFSHHTYLCKLRDGKLLTMLPLGTIVLNFTKDKNGHSWVACYNNGLFELNEKDSVINHYFEKLTINDVLIDSQNGLWASSAGGGLFHCANLDDRQFPEDSPLGRPISFLKLMEDRLYAGNNMGDVYSIKNNQFTLFRKHVTEDESKDILKIGDRYLISSMYSVEQSGFYSGPAPHKTIPNSAQKIITKGDTIFFLLRKRILILINGTFQKAINFNYKAFSFALRKDKFILAMENGLWLLDNSTLSRPDYLEPTRQAKCKAIIADPEGNYWTSTEGNGLYKLLPDNSLLNYTIADGLPGNIINNLSFGASGVLLSSNTGLYYTKAIHPGAVWKKLYAGLVNNALFYEEKIYLATRNGLVILDSKKITGNEQIHFNLSGINVNSKAVNQGTFKTLEHYQNNLEFNFDVISFSDESYNLNYNLQGESSDSGSVDAYAISFQKLPSGNYTLSVYPEIPGGESLQLTIPFSIIPAFWQTNTFIFLVVSVLILVGVMITIMVFRYLRKKESRKNKAERLIQEYKLIALKAQINPHFMSNCLTAIQHLIINNKVDLATDYIAKFGLLVRQILNFSTRSLVTIQEELEITALNIELEQLRFEKRFLVEIKTDAQVNAKAIFIPALILNPIIENAIWHGLLPLKNSRQGKLLIEVKIEHDTLLLIIEDNGVGKKKAAEIMSNSRESKGIALTGQRLNNINYMFNIRNSQLVYQDLNDEAKGQYGTRVIISLPVNLKPLQNE